MDSKKVMYEVFDAEKLHSRIEARTFGLFILIKR